MNGLLVDLFAGGGGASAGIESALGRTIEQKRVTYDFHRLMDGAELLRTSEFADAMIGNM